MGIHCQYRQVDVEVSKHTLSQCDLIVGISWDHMFNCRLARCWESIYSLASDELCSIEIDFLDSKPRLL
jgi:hypothetical protein